jgi:g-D-glutamyl-meso-diaminopimelate peptidase
MPKILLCLLCLFLLYTPEDAGAAELDRPYSYQSQVRDLMELRFKYKKELTFRVIGTAHSGRKIWAVKLGKGEKNILLVGSHHGREWMTSMLLTKMLKTYTEAYAKGKPIGSFPSDLLNEVSIWFVPMLNPDGVTIQQKGYSEFPFWDKDKIIKMNNGSSDFTRWKANGIGVDLNRQYPAGWNKLDRTTPTPSYQFYKGKVPLEAHEVICLVKFVKEISPEIAGAYHTAGREIFWNYHNGPNIKRDRAIAKKITKMTGYKLSKPVREAVGGGFTDWFITEYRRPAFTIEISYLVGESHPPLSVFPEEWKRNRLVGMLLANEAYKLIWKK